MQIEKFNNENDVKLLLANQYIKQINNYFGDEKRALRFLSGVISAIQRTPKLLECTPTSLINSFMTMAQLELMPSDVSGEAYVLPYENRKAKTCEAQFQLGYQGLVTLFYRAGCKSITAEIVHENDTFKFKNGEVDHESDPFGERGPAKGAYVIVELHTGGKISKVMSKDEILKIGSKFSKSYSSDFTPWKQENDPQLWMWRKTVLKQAAKLVPKNEKIVQAIAEDNKDSNISDRLKAAEDESKTLQMGNLLKNEQAENTTATENNQAEDNKANDALAESDNGQTERAI